jgi:hypothetical protein
MLPDRNGVAAIAQLAADRGCLPTAFWLNFADDLAGWASRWGHGGAGGRAALAEGRSLWVALLRWVESARVGPRGKPDVSARIAGKRSHPMVANRRLPLLHEGSALEPPDRSVILE